MNESSKKWMDRWVDEWTQVDEWGRQTVSEMVDPENLSLKLSRCLNSLTII